VSNSPDMPWLVQAWQTLQHRLDGGKLPHAWLITAEAGVGKRTWADHAAHMLVCGQSPAPCGQCRQCQLVAGGSHPDIRAYGPENRSRVIKVSQIRELIGFAMTSPQVSHRKVAIIDRADQLNPSAANALLKTLEEPPEDLVLILLQESGRPILPTIRSRCQVMTLPAPGPGQALVWLQEAASDLEQVSEESCLKALQLAGGAPRQALEYLQTDIVAGRDRALDHFRQYLKAQITVNEAARPFKDLGLEQSLRLLEGWAADLARLGAGGEASDTTASDVLGYLAGRNSAWRAHELLAAIQKSRAAMTNNVNPDLEIQRLLIGWQGLMPRKSAGPKVAGQGAAH